MDATETDTQRGQLGPPVSRAVESGRAAWLRRGHWIELAFFASGFSALTYQIAWQRLLFVSFGVDIESVTIIVSTFMLGLGLGALGGGVIGARFPGSLLLLFAGCEAGTGIFGLASASLIPLVGDRFVSDSAPVVALVNLALLLFPTTLMGASLPLLVADSVNQSRNVGVSVGGLYFINTLGAALACLLIGFVWFNWFGLRAAIDLAASVNIVVAVLVLVVAWKSR